ncbi:MAG: histidine--tRNA ligase [Candidatus Nezhaarchaeota archaeon]|nr:histidine--tRNA ligase [Candidatus Nezhaarchaeota archaeon]MCX8141713.1 histidine--tRNA ligase [Candidatus Nezhaarchaeota archaeon]MDW8049980.1 histidine--tRNA ligase [Nitrososphaerota archaeon]
MSKIKLKRPRGTRDLLPWDMIKRRHVMETIRSVFELYGYDEVETPAFEFLDILTAKCGPEVREQIYSFKDKAGRDLGLRFDLTVPLARIIASNPNIPKPFKRYCISRVWRYEEPQSGRFREFWQADVDIVGSSKMESDAEVIAVAITCLKKLGMKNFKVRLNNRKILESIVLSAGVDETSSLSIFRAIDKLDKLGYEGVKQELKKLGLTDLQISMIMRQISKSGNLDDIEGEVNHLLTARGKEGINELAEIISNLELYEYANHVIVDLSLARGLDYYTGPIFEISAETTVNVGSVAGGGRYDNLIELLGGPPTPATGISLGIDRIVEVLDEACMLPSAKTRTQVFVAYVNPSVKPEAFRIAEKLRAEGIKVEVDLMGRKLDRQLKYADVKGIPYAIMIGPEELKQGIYKLRDMRNRNEKLLTFQKIVDIIKLASPT